jgi:hypothetical protein
LKVVQLVKDKRNKKKETLSDSWGEFSQEMNERINVMAKNTGKDLEDHYKMWREYSQKMTDMMAKFTPEDEKALGDIQNLWMEYSEKIGTKFVDVMERETGPSKELYKMWTDYSTKMGDQISELMSESIKEQKDLYELWMDSFGIKDNGHENNIPDFFKEMSQFWQNMWMKSKDMPLPISPGDMKLNADYKELSEFWTNAYSKMVKNMINSPDFAKMDGNILEANLEAIKIKDELANKYLSAMGLPTKDNLDDIYQKLHDMDRKISEISRAINSKKT